MKVTISIDLNPIDHEIIRILKRSPYSLTVEQIRHQLARKNIEKSSTAIAREMNMLAMYFIVQKTKGTRVCSYSMPEDSEPQNS